MIKEIMLKREELYSKYATFDHEAIRFEAFKADIRPNFFRDIDRIIHADSFTRYIDKTQVYSEIKNDHISKRMTHVQLVSKIGRTIGRALSLNEDLIEAIALGHDLGHTPFGHVGEKILDKISQKHGEGNFMHNVQSIRTLMVIEKKNLTVQVLDGILCHNGEFMQNEYHPKKKTVKDFTNDYEKCYQDAKHVKKLVPMTLEGCVVRISDIVGYIGRDIEDAVNLGLFDKKLLPKEIVNILGNKNRDIINSIVLDIIDNSLNKPYIKLSDNMYKAIKDLKNFNYENIYYKAQTKKQLASYELMFECLFDKLGIILEKKDKAQNIYREFLDKRDKNYLKNTTNNRKIIDYLAGMTDDYKIEEYHQLKDY